LLIFHRIVTIVALPFLALLGLLFLCVRVALAASMRLLGWNLAWPPVELADREGEQRIK
jgi:hypothetical protein